jgi:hypothetical protein
LRKFLRFSILPPYLWINGSGGYRYVILDRDAQVILGVAATTTNKDTSEDSLCRRAAETCHRENDEDARRERLANFAFALR